MVSILSPAIPWCQACTLLVTGDRHPSMYLHRLVQISGEKTTSPWPSVNSLFRSGWHNKPLCTEELTLSTVRSVLYLSSWRGGGGGPPKSFPFPLGWSCLCSASGPLRSHLLVYANQMKRQGGARPEGPTSCWEVGGCEPSDVSPASSEGQAEVQAHSPGSVVPTCALTPPHRL